MNEDFATDRAGVSGAEMAMLETSSEKEDPFRGDRLSETERPENALWLGDTGTLSFNARSAFLQLIRGPYIDETRDERLWNALLNERGEIASRLADLFLDLVIDMDHGVAFARNATSSETELPKTARSNKMTLLDTVMVLLLRKELTMNPLGRTIVGQDEVFEQMAPYRKLSKQDPAKYRERLKSSWNRLVEARILVRSDVKERYEISPVLRILFDADHADAVNDELAQLLEKKRESSDDRE